MTLTKSDLNEIKSIVDKVVDERLEEKLNSKLSGFRSEMLDEIDVKLTNLKSEFFDRVDPVLKEVMTAREERSLIENRIESLEKIHPKGKHVLTP